jgi:ABC-type transport system involved in cytochrome bd biosynthesis fused ATPase/permease subunit
VKPSEGSFNLDEKVVDLSSLHWQNTLGYVPQNVFISNDTVFSNLLFDKVQSSSTESEVLNVLSTCQLSNLIDNLPKGIHSPIGESGSMISGGERQRIGLARALLRKATSGLDHSTEMNILKDLFSTKGDMTIVVSSHSKSALSLCDRVFEF